MEIEPQKTEARRALLIQSAFIGDVILTTPMIRAFKESFPKTHLCVLVRPEAAALLQDHAFVDELLVFDKKNKDRGPLGMLRMIRKLRSGNFDLLLSPHQSHRSALLAIFSAIPLRFGYAGHLLARFAYQHHLRRDMQVPEIERLFSFLEAVLKYYARSYSTKKFNRQACIYIKSEELSIAKNLLQDSRAHQPLVIAPSSVWPTKRWPPWHFAVLIGKLVRQYHRKVLLVGAPQDIEINANVMHYIKNFQPAWVQEEVHDISGKLSLQGLYGLLSLSSLLISNDSAPVHLGCAAGIPVVAIFGPTVPALGYAPLTPRSTVVQKELACRPCGLHGHKQCPQGHFRCMKELSPLEVLAGVRKVLA